jgi:lipopolysaccharide transport system permease protein
VKHGLRLAFYVSPALFSFDRLINIAGNYPPLDTILLLNPMVWILNAYRTVLYAGESPDWLALLITGFTSIPFTLLSIYIFRRLSPSFAKVL